MTYGSILDDIHPSLYLTLCSGIRCKCLVRKIPAKGTQASCPHWGSQPRPIPCAGLENGFKKPILPLLMTYIFRGHSPTWMTFHGTLTAQLGQIWIHQRRINARWISMLWKQQIWSRVFTSSTVFMLTFPILPFPQVWWPAAAAKDCDPNQKRIRPFVFLISPDQTTSRLIMYLFLHYDDMKAFIMFLWSKTIFIHMCTFDYMLIS